MGKSATIVVLTALALAGCVNAERVPVIGTDVGATIQAFDGAMLVFEWPLPVRRLTPIPAIGWMPQG